ncbi:Ribosomal protein L37 mitochondrial [Penicillium odoratum]|uniref:Ribosomal protein L37 mitochondrial n=1 Tax=Penicillium odoratum TaxID=1167516 RepID=UPI0025469630|nr:Ribosomal protein L37 mitochondrial [Penicillium odoratum]KAJ5772179.1 Ribosomal protein L37 mitochondrial [Penicillium odoratum]
MLSRLPQQQALAWTSSPARQLPLIRSQFRFYSDKGTNPPVNPSSPPSPRQPSVGDVTTPSAISSATPGVSQPLSTPETVHIDVQPGAATKPVVERPPSSCPVGTKMNGLNYFKNKPDIVAKEDSEYPDWLWDLLGDSSKSAKAEKGGVDPSTLNKKQRKRYEKKLAARVGVLPPKIPAHHHAHDITPAPYNRDGLPEIGITDATESADQRTEVTRSARQARRKAIKESNFLRGL